MGGVIGRGGVWGLRGRVGRGTVEDEVKISRVKGGRVF